MAIAIVSGPDGVYVGGFSSGFRRPVVCEPVEDAVYQNRMARMEKALERAAVLERTNPDAAYRVLAVAEELEQEALARRGQKRVDVTV